MSVATAGAEANAVITATLASDHAEQARIILASENLPALAAALASMFAAAFEQWSRSWGADPQEFWQVAATRYAALDAAE